MKMEINSLFLYKLPNINYTTSPSIESHWIVITYTTIVADSKLQRALAFNAEDLTWGWSKNSAVGEWVEQVKKKHTKSSVTQKLQWHH